MYHFTSPGDVRGNCGGGGEVPLVAQRSQAPRDSRGSRLKTLPCPFLSLQAACISPSSGYISRPHTYGPGTSTSETHKPMGKEEGALVLRIFPGASLTHTTSQPLAHTGERQTLAYPCDPPEPEASLGPHTYQWWWVVSTVVSFTPCFFTVSTTCGHRGSQIKVCHTPGP